MPHHTPLIATIVVGLVLAFCLGALAHRLRASPLVGYLLAGIVMGRSPRASSPTRTLANELAEIGVILLMFGVGLHFSLKDLLSVRAHRDSRRDRADRDRDPARHGAGPCAGLDHGRGLVFGLALSVASTVVLLRALQERRLVETERGRIAVGWLIVEDLAMVLALVMLPALAGMLTGAARRGIRSAVALPLAVTLGKVVAFVALHADRRPPGDSRGSCTTSRTPARANCSASRCSPSRSASPMAPRRCSTCRSRSAPSSPA